MIINYKEVRLEVTFNRVFDEIHIDSVYVGTTDIYTLLTQNQLEEIETLILNEL